MMDRIELERILQGLALGPARYFDRIGSTNAEALRWADEGAPDLALVVANEQTAGRGRQGRRWSTPPGTALAFSLVLRDPPADDPSGRVVARRMARLTALGALAVSQALRQAYSLPAEIKWPNDVLLERRKVGGILAEAQWLGERLSAVVLGIGVNVAPASVPLDSEVIYPAACVESALGREAERWQLLRAVLEQFLSWRSRLESQAFLDAWEERLAFKGEQVYLYTGTAVQDQPDHQGILVGLDAEGCLQIRSQTGELCSLCNGELRLRPSAEPVSRAEIFIREKP
jgi:BirA family biotin operon repressor/biotin-[acetyl-CoA-carboxylase] ligase